MTLLNKTKKFLAVAFAFVLLATLSINVNVKAEDVVEGTEHKGVLVNSVVDCADTATYAESNEKFHTVSDFYECKDCADTMRVDREVAHTFAWDTNYDGAYFYSCKDCDYNLNGEFTTDLTIKDSVKVKKSKTYTIDCAKHDKVKSIKVTSGSKYAKVTKNTKNPLKFKVTGKKKGTIKIKVTMNSKATRTYTIKVK